VIYEHKIGRDVPLNSEAIVVNGLVIAGDQEFDIEVPSVSIRGSFTLAGAPFPVSATESALIQARDQQTGALTPLGETVDQTYSARLIPETYDLMYSRIAGSEIVPANKLTAFRRDVSLVASGALDIDVLVVSISGQYTINGDPAPMSPLESGHIFILDPETQAETLIGKTSDQIYRVLLIPGDYDLKYDRIAGADIAPANSSARFLTGIPFTENSTHDLDVPSVQISGNFLVNGAPAPASVTENARIRLRHGEDVVHLGETRVGQFQVRVIPGTYDIAFEGMTAGDIMPANGDGVLGAIEIAGASEFDIDIPAIGFAAELRFNGGNFPGPVAGELARLYLEDTQTADLIFLGSYPAVEQAHRLVIPGTYRVRYEYVSGIELPRNPFGVLDEDRTLIENVHTVINIRAVSLAGTFSLAGGAFPAGPGENAAIGLQSSNPGDALHLGGTASGGYSTVILPGRYDAFYNWAQGDIIPRNQKARLECPDPR
jgi:hypothetical protein